MHTQECKAENEEMTWWAAWEWSAQAPNWKKQTRIAGDDVRYCDRNWVRTSCKFTNRTTKRTNNTVIWTRRCFGNWRRHRTKKTTNYDNSNKLDLVVVAFAVAVLLLWTIKFHNRNAISISVTIHMLLWWYTQDCIERVCVYCSIQQGRTPKLQWHHDYCFYGFASVVVCHNRRHCVNCIAIGRYFIRFKFKQLSAEIHVIAPFLIRIETYGCCCLYSFWIFMSLITIKWATRNREILLNKTTQDTITISIAFCRFFHLCMPLLPSAIDHFEITNTVQKFRCEVEKKSRKPNRFSMGYQDHVE